MAQLVLGQIAWAQRVPGRDLLEYPIGAIGEAPPLASLSSDGLWNPATVLLEPGQRARVTVGALEGPSEMGIITQVASVAYAVDPLATLAFSVVRAYVEDLARTEGDPQTIGSDIKYGTTLFSASAAGSVTTILDVGLALRHRLGELDTDRRRATLVDVGVLLHDFGFADMRLAASSFLLRPGRRTDADEARLSAGADVRALGVSDRAQLRVGYSYSRSSGLATEHYLFASGQILPLEVNAGVLHSSSHGGGASRYRLGIGLRSSSFRAGLAREENASGLAPTYQVMIAAFILR